MNKYIRLEENRGDRGNRGVGFKEQMYVCIKLFIWI